MTKINLENAIQDYLDSVYVISHSKSSVDVYKSGINHFSKFVQIKYDQSLEQIISSIEKNSMDRYTILKDFVIHLDKAGKKPASIQIWVVGAKASFKVGKIFESRMKPVITKIPINVVFIIFLSAHIIRH